MVEMDAVYEGGLHCRVKHGPSGAEIVTDAPKDNHGKGEAFSPTDLLATSLGVCILTTMAIYAQGKEIPLEGSRAHVVKEMIADPVRRVGRITVVLDLPARIEESRRPVLERVAHTCPVHRSLHPDVQLDVTIRYTL